MVWEVSSVGSSTMSGTWRLAFLVQLPLTLASVVMICIHVEKPKMLEGQFRLKRVDFLGSSLLIATLVLFLMGLNSGGNIVPWIHPLVLTALPFSAILFCAFVTVEEKVAVIQSYLLASYSIAQWLVDASQTSSSL